jgi:oligopeptide/dipeptide ABC transporter ATP-binding protein
VIYAGQIVEIGPARSVLRRPLHPYTRALLGAVPRPGADTERLTSIPGTVPHPHRMPSGCRFHPRCQFAQRDCAQGRVPLLEAGPDRQVRCPYFQSLP